MRSSSLALVSFAAIAPALAGDLTPPPGPVLETMKTLDEVEPRTPIGADTTAGDATATYVIAAPGSYYLTANLVGEAAKDGIRIDASGVTIDLSGFVVQGVAGSLTGIACSLTLAGDIVIENGSITAWDEWAVDITHTQSFPPPQARNVRLDRLRAVRNGHGMRVTGVASAMIDCVALENDGSGLIGGSGSRFVRCQALGNLGGTGNTSGINGGYGSAFVDCAANGNGDHGFSSGWASTMTNCVAGANGQMGFNLGFNSTATGCVALDNASFGFRMESDTMLRDCRATGNSHGFLFVGDRLRLDGCVASGNFGLGFGYLLMDDGHHVSMEGCDAVDNEDGGIALGDAASLLRCTARANGGNGISVGPDSQLNDCSSVGNAGVGAQIGPGGAVRGGSFNGNANGLTIDDATLVERCVIRGNTGYGVHAEDTTTNEDDGQCRIDGNMIDTNGVAGIFVEDQTVITNNTIALNGAAGGVNGGVVVGSRGSRIDSNAFTQNSGAGLRLIGDRNVVARNTFFLNASHLIDGGGNTIGAFGSIATAGAWDNIAH